MMLPSHQSAGVHAGKERLKLRSLQCCSPETLNRNSELSKFCVHSLPICVVNSDDDYFGFARIADASNSLEDVRHLPSSLAMALVLENKRSRTTDGILACQTFAAKRWYNPATELS